MSSGIELESKEGDGIMETQNESDSKSNSAEAAEHIASAHQVLKALQEKIGKHPELADAITRLEMALSILTVKTGGML
jgi:hypothetical protein